MKEFQVARSEVHAFSDASEEAIATVVYLKQVSCGKEINLSFVYAQTKLSPKRPTTVPRLELCAAVLSTQAVKRVLEELNIKIEKVTYYTDSKVVLAYIQNETRRFYAYVANRIQIMRKLSDPTQWEYVETHRNPGDLATRGLSVRNLTETAWLTGPEFLKNPGHQEVLKVACCLEADDPELRPANACLATKISERKGFGSSKVCSFFLLAESSSSSGNPYSWDPTI